MNEKRKKKDFSPVIDFSCSKSVALIKNNQQTKIQSTLISKLLSTKKKKSSPRTTRGE